MRILLADDDLITLRLLENTLKRRNYETILAHDGQEAWELLHQPPIPEVALLDWMMPHLNGIDITKRLRMEKDTEFVYIILLTSNDRPEDITAGLDAGANDYVTKPFDKDELKSRIAVGARVAEYEISLKRINAELKIYSLKMESLAQERAQQLVQADRMISLGTMAAGIAHEINNPLTIIQGNVGLLKGFWKNFGLASYEEYLKTHSSLGYHPAGHEVTDMVETAENAVHRIRSIVDGMRSFSHGQGGKIEELFPLTCLTDAIQICLPKTKHLGGVKSRVEDIPFPVKGNPVQITQVLVNLIANAADALAGTPGPEIQVIIQPVDQTLQFAVKDNGPGIPPGALDELWSPFYTTKPVGKGTGLGLSICKKIVESAPGQGTTFFFNLHNEQDYDRIMSTREQGKDNSGDGNDTLRF
jgi:signal transduction histidine kinase